MGESKEPVLVKPAHIPRTHVRVVIKTPPGISGAALETAAGSLEQLVGEMRQVNPRSQPIRDVVLERWASTIQSSLDVLTRMKEVLVLE